MLQIKCQHCGAILKAKEIIINQFIVKEDAVAYKEYICICSKCNQSVEWDRYAQKAAENKAKAMAKLARKTKKTVKQITEAEKYNAIMKKAGKRAREFAKYHTSNVAVTVLDLNMAIDELPQDEKQIVLAYEDKQDMGLLKAGTHKPTKHIKSNSILLMTQAIIESAIEENDEDFFKSEYGAQVVDTYNLALTDHKHHDYGITAALLLEKMRKGELVKGEDDDA